MTSGQQRRQQQALQQALEQTYQPLGSNLFQPASTGTGDLSTQDAAVATAATETERVGKTVTYNNYFPVQKIDDELDARDLARKVAAELARMPSR
jgi:translation initiation factor 1 (eIF-1/SUI1)